MVDRQCKISFISGIHTWSAMTSDMKTLCQAKYSNEHVLAQLFLVIVHAYHKEF